MPRVKIGPALRKGLWVGGMVPLGYDTNERRITINEAEADNEWLDELRLLHRVSLL